MKRIILLLVLTLGTISLYSQERWNPDKMPSWMDTNSSEEELHIAKASDPIKKEMIFYRWQTKEIAKELITSGSYKPHLVEHYMGRMDAYGPGLYIADNPWSSIGYGDELVELVVKKGTLSLDLLDEGAGSQSERLEKYNQYNNTRYTRNDLILKYWSNGMRWWVVRGQPEITFRRFTGEGLDISELITFYKKVDEFRTPGVTQHRGDLPPIKIPGHKKPLTSEYKKKIIEVLEERFYRTSSAKSKKEIKSFFSQVNHILSGRGSLGCNQYLK